MRRARKTWYYAEGRSAGFRRGDQSSGHFDAIDEGRVTNAQVEVVISNNSGAFALERARRHGIEALCVSPRDYGTREEFNQALLETVDRYELDLIVLAGFLVKVPEIMIEKYRNRIINIHPSLIPSFCGVGYYGLKVHEAALKRGGEADGSYGAFCGRGYGLRPHPAAEGGGGAAGGYAGEFAETGDGAGGMAAAAPGH